MSALAWLGAGVGGLVLMVGLMASWLLHRRDRLDARLDDEYRRAWPIASSRGGVNRR